MNNIAWFKENLRRIHILYVSPEWAKDRGRRFDAAEYVRRLSGANVGCVELYAKDHHGYCYYQSATGRQYPQDVLGQMLRECRKRKIKLMAYYSVGFDNFASGMYPEWLHVDKKGEFREFKFTRFICLNSPYRDYALRQIEELVSQYKVDGIWLDVVPVTWQGFQKIGWFGEVAPFCYCIYCRRKYKEEYGRDIPWDPQEDELIAGYKFWLKGVSSFLQDVSRLIKRYLPEALIAYNAAGNPHDPVNSADIISIEGHAPQYYHQSFLARWGKVNKKPMEILSAGAISGWDGWDQKSYPILRLESSIGLAHGIGLTFGQQPYPDGSFEEKDFKALGCLFGWLRKMEKDCLNPNGVSQIGLLLSLKNWDAPNLGVEALAETEGIHQVFLSSHLQYDILTDTKKLNKYPLVIIGNQNALSDKEIKNIKEYVKKGGKILVTGLTSLFDEKGKRRKDFGLHDVMGLSFALIGEFPVAYIDYSTLILVEDKMIEVKKKKDDVLYKFFYPETTWTKGTTVLWGNPPPDRQYPYPCVLHNRFGKGECIYIAFGLGENIFRHESSRTLKEHWLKDLFMRLVDMLLSERILKTDLPEGVEVVLNKIKNKYILHLVNYYAGTPGMSFLDETSRISGGEVRFNINKVGRIKRAYTIPDGQELQLQQEQDDLVLSLPPFSVNLVVGLETK